MNFFETELKKMTAKVAALKNPKLVGSACIARLTDTTTVKVEFAKCIEADRLKRNPVTGTVCKEYGIAF